jgi:multicomponent Na+:H+ antiporter subunit D
VVHMVGGGLLLAGILFHVAATGSLAIRAFPQVYSVASVLILLGVAVNAAIPPLHAWLADAYPKATVTGAVFMSAFTTKSAVFVLMELFPGWQILLWFGVAMTLYGVVYAVLANDIREILAYHIISQVGYMVAGVGIGTEMALNGAAAHAYSHILYKSLLFMGAGAVLHATGRSKLTDLGGIGGRMKWPLALYMVGAFSISGFPLFNGFISKSMIVSAAGYAHYEVAMLLLILASIGTFYCTALKIPYFAWFGPQRPVLEVKPVPGTMLAAMGVGAFLCFLYGVWPQLLYDRLPYVVTYNPFTVYHLVEVTQVLTMSFLAFWWMRAKLAADTKLALDTDWLYRRPADFVGGVFAGGASRLFDWSEQAVDNAAGWVARISQQPMRWLLPLRRPVVDPGRYTPSLEAVIGLLLLATVIFILWP